MLQADGKVDHLCLC